MKSEQFIAWIIVAFMVFALCSRIASASPHTLRFQNPDTTRTYTAIRTEWGTVPVSCGPGATCEVTLDIPFGSRMIIGQATDSLQWSGDSNAINVLVQPTPAECLAIPACRHDADGNGLVTVGDFGSFMSTLGRSWIP